MNRRSLLGALGASGAGVITHILGRSEPVRAIRGTGVLHRPAATHVEGGIADSPDRFHHATLLTSGNADTVVAPSDGAIAQTRDEIDFDTEFGLVVQARRPASESVSIRFESRTNRTGFRRIATSAILEPWGMPLPDDLEGTDETIYTELHVFSSLTFGIDQITVDLRTPEAEPVTTLKTE